MGLQSISRMGTYLFLFQLCFERRAASSLRAAVLLLGFHEGGKSMIGVGKLAILALGLMAAGGREAQPEGIPIDPPRSEHPVVVYPPGSTEPMIPGETSNAPAPEVAPQPQTKAAQPQAKAAQSQTKAAPVQTGTAQPQQTPAAQTQTATPPELPAATATQPAP